MVAVFLSVSFLMNEYILIIDIQWQAGYHFKWCKGVESDESGITE